MSFGPDDVRWFLVAAVVLLVPGASVLAAAGWFRRGRAAIAAGAAPLTSVAVCYVAAVVTGTVGVRYGLVAVTVTTVVLTAAAAVVRGVRRGSLSDDRVLWRRPPWRRWAEPAGGAVLVATAAVISLRTWAQVLGGSLATPPQEPDMVTHTLLTAHIADSGRAAPWLAWTYDVQSGSPNGFYPAGFHSVAALVADSGTDAVTAVNATMIVVLAVCLPLGLFGLASQLRLAPLRHLVGGVAAVISSMAYRPTYAILHDGGILANDMAISLSAGTIAALLALRGSHATLRHRQWWFDVAVVALVVLGAFSIHPTSAAIVGLSVVAWFVGDLVRRGDRRAARRWMLTMIVGAVVGGLMALPLLGGAGSVGTVIHWQRDLDPQSFSRAVGITVGMPYLGFLDPGGLRSQALFAVLTLAGVAVSLWTRRHAGLLAAWAAWSFVLLVFLLDRAVPGVTTVASLFYNSYVRISGVLAPFQWLLGGVAVTTAAVVAVRWSVRLVSVVSRSRVLVRSRTPLVAAAALVLGVALVLSTTNYRLVNGSSLATRYAEPAYLRLGPDDRAAFNWLAGEVQPGERVMNNANDGSTYMYVYDQIPIVNVSALGSGAAPYTEQLLAGFNQLDTDRGVQQIVRSLDIRWVYFDSNSPPVFVADGVYPWYKGGQLYSIAPGMTNLDDVAGLTKRFTSGSVSVYQVDGKYLPQRQ